MLSRKLLNDNFTQKFRKSNKLIGKVSILKMLMIINT